MLYPSCVDLEQAVPIEGGKYLFHYTSYSSALGILLSQQMRLSSLVNMNDPLEFQDHHNDGVVSNDNPTNEECAARLFMFLNAVTEKENSVRLACFSMDTPFPDKSERGQTNYYNNLSKGWARSRMWAQYADNHKGVCLIFDKLCLEKEFKGSFEKSSCETFCDVVNYTNNLNPIRNAFDQSCESFLTPDRIKFLYQKCEDFRDEQEYRLLLINKALKNTDELVSFSVANSLCGVITGARFPEENKLSLKKAMDCCNPKMKRFSIWWDYGEPNLNDPAYWKSLMPEDAADENNFSR
ncbi:DUF2971 domain-containing protein [Fibrobacter sp.]|uniref:DUF2971 domain-containing protein n=1 Tax=Fibrobacter sp. TaxID=35828 RepID=UPI0026377E36|nr:DUF2971 domain-containing protein [Fibrobacter sp.]MDD5942883.1 DUF2971 domain-containing protein [Fibrobacter sp.]